MKKESTVKTPLGMRKIYFIPIKSETAGKRATYDEKLDMGHAVKGYLSVTTASAQIVGDDVTQVDLDRFVSAQLDTETTMSDLEVNAKLFGHTYSEATGEISNGDDTSPYGGVAYIEPILTKDKKLLFRPTCLFKASAIASSEKQESDTKKPGELSPKYNAVSFKITEDNLGNWRARNDFDTMAEAELFIDTTFGIGADAAAVSGQSSQ